MKYRSRSDEQRSSRQGIAPVVPCTTQYDMVTTMLRYGDLPCDFVGRHGTTSGNWWQNIVATMWCDGTTCVTMCTTPYGQCTTLLGRSYDLGAGMLRAAGGSILSRGNSHLLHRAGKARYKSGKGVAVGIQFSRHSSLSHFSLTDNARTTIRHASLPSCEVYAPQGAPGD